MPHARSLDFAQDGTAHHRGAATPFLPALDNIAAGQPQHRAGTRLHAIPELTQLLATGQVHAIAAEHLDPSAHPVRAILFDKSAAANWRSPGTRTGRSPSAPATMSPATVHGPSSRASATSRHPSP